MTVPYLLFLHLCCYLPVFHSYMNGALCWAPHNLWKLVLAMAWNFP